jgi:hypothetical protein
MRSIDIPKDPPQKKASSFPKLRANLKIASGQSTTPPIERTHKQGDRLFPDLRNRIAGVPAK